MGACDNFPEGNQIYEILAQEARENMIPLSGTFELTPRCNFNCKMCYVHLNTAKIPEYGSELTAEEWISIAEQAKEAGMLQLCITGGEPIMHPEFSKIYRALSQMGFFITLQTNASTMTKEVLNLIEEYPPSLVKITVYGSNDDVYRGVCGVENGFQRVDEGIRSLLKLEIPMMLVTTVIKQNKEDLANIARYSQELSVPWIYTTAVHPSVRGADTDAREVAIDESAATDFREDVRRMMAEPMVKDGSKPCDYCKGYRNSFWVTWNGRMQFCSFRNEPDILVRDCSFKEAWKNLVEFEEQLRWPEECTICDVRHVCRRCAGMLAARSGRADHVDQEFCERFRKYVKEEGAY